MSKTEDYLDSLLNNVTPERKAESKRKKRRKKTNFEEDFENELNGVGADDFAQDFQADMEDSDYAGSAGDSFFDDLEGIINNINEPSTDDTAESPPEEPFEVNTLVDDTWTEDAEQENSQPEVEFIDDPDKLDELLEAENGNRDSDASKAAKEKKPGIFKKLGAALFGGEDDEMPEDDSPQTSDTPASSDEEYKGLDEEQMQILRDLDLAGEPHTSPAAEEPEQEQKQGKKKKEKKMKKEKKVKEKKPKEKKPKKVKKPKKEKPKKEKPKKPKAVDLSPPLPKVPVVLIFIMAISAGAFVLISANLMVYSSSLTAAKQAYQSQDYVEAYRQMAGIEPKEEDEELNARIALLAGVQGEINKGNALYESGQYTMALDAYICALGRYDTNYSDASLYGAEAEYDVLASQAETQISEKFGVNAQTAREIYGLEDRTEYTVRIYNIVKALGLE
ncbi:MAG: hypothetical protein HFJ05_05595 [Eubacterium sp.]|nr:hypothetical protein [Eubacterium sp.]